MVKQWRNIWYKFWENRKGPGKFNIKHNRKQVILSEPVIINTTSKEAEFKPIDIIKKLPWHKTRRWKTREAHVIDKVVFHQSMSGGATTGINKYHIKPNHISSRGCPHVCYHYTIEKDGTVYQCNSIESITWHTKGRNYNSIGVLILGDFDGYEHKGPDIVTKAQKDSMLKVIKYLSDLESINVANRDFYCHDDFGKPACPGYVIHQVLQDYKV